MKTIVQAKETGYMDKDSFLTHVEKVVLPYVKQTREQLPLEQHKTILILDQHRSRECLRAIDLLLCNDIQLLGLPPHTTHMFQPLDADPFLQLKNCLANYELENAGTSMDELAKVVYVTTLEAFQAEVIKGSFEKVGIYPFSYQQVLSRLPESCWRNSVQNDNVFFSLISFSSTERFLLTLFQLIAKAKFRRRE
jgi:hypothetical protein